MGGKERDGEVWRVKKIESDWERGRENGRK